MKDWLTADVFCSPQILQQPAKVAADNKPVNLSLFLIVGQARLDNFIPWINEFII